MELELVMSNAKPLMSSTISAMRPGDKDLADIGECRGLRITCGSTGKKSFYYRYTSPVSQKLTQIHIGHFSSMSLAEARMCLQKLKDKKRQGKCPVAEMKAELQLQATLRKKSDDALTVHGLVDLYLEGHVEDRISKGRTITGARNKKGQLEARRTLYHDVVSVIGRRKANEIMRKDVVKLISGIVDRGSSVQAGNVLRELNAAFEYAIGLDHFDDSYANPALLAKNSLRQAKVKMTPKKGRRTLSDVELKQLLEWLPGSAFTPTQKNILRFTVWTGCRTGEICQARWEDIDFEHATWHLRATKTGVERFVQLPDQAMEFLKQLQLTTGEYLFPSMKTGVAIQQKSLTEQAWQLRKTHRMIAIDHWSPHDLRRTVRTGLSRIGCPSEVAEAILGHARSGIQGTYDLHRYEAECRVWLQRWADKLVKLIDSV